MDKQDTTLFQVQNQLLIDRRDRFTAFKDLNYVNNEAIEVPTKNCHIDRVVKYIPV